MRWGKRGSISMEANAVRPVSVLSSSVVLEMFTSSNFSSLLKSSVSLARFSRERC